MIVGFVAAALLPRKRLHMQTEWLENIKSETPAQTQDSEEGVQTDGAQQEDAQSKLPEDDFGEIDLSSFDL